MIGMTAIGTTSGTLLGGRYRLVAEAGRGGMSTVYRARDEHLGRDVAVKVLVPDVTGSGDARRQREEVRLLAGLAHPGLVTLFDADIAGDTPYIVMEYVAGATLADLIGRGPLPESQVRTIASGVAQALDYVHSRGLVHRDIKPANILVPGSDGDPAARARLADFGIARLVDATRITSTGTLIGTAAYISPEQARGDAVGPPSDIYSFGLVILEALTAERAFPGTPIESVAARLSRGPAVPARVPAEWSDLLSAMTAAEPGDRPDAAEAALRMTRIPSNARAHPGGTGREPVTIEPDDGDPTRRMDPSRPASSSTGPRPTLVLPVAERPPTAVTVESVDPVDRTEPRADDPTRPKADDPTRRRRRRPLLVAVLLAAAAALTAVGVGVATSTPAPPPPAPDYPAVDGELGEHLDELQRSVEP